MCVWWLVLLGSLLAFWDPAPTRRIDLADSFSASRHRSQNYFVGAGSIEVPRGAQVRFEIAKTSRAAGGAASVIAIGEVYISSTPHEDLTEPRTLRAFLKRSKVRRREVLARFESEHGYAVMYRDLERGSVREHFGMVPPGGTLSVTARYRRVSCGAEPETRAAAERAFRVCTSYRP